MFKLAVALTLALFGLTATASADAIQKWRTPNGSFYFGDHPPAGSTLLVTYPETAPPPVTVIPSEAPLAQAAADGREIIRQREAERAATRRDDAEREARQAEIAARASEDYDYPFWFITSTVIPCRFGDSCFHDHHGHHHHHGEHHDGQRRIGDALAARGTGFLTPIAPPPHMGAQPSQSSRHGFLR
jgi:hypothetical protein